MIARCVKIFQIFEKLTQRTSYGIGHTKPNEEVWDEKPINRERSWLHLA